MKRPKTIPLPLSAATMMTTMYFYRRVFRSGDTSPKRVRTTTSTPDAFGVLVVVALLVVIVSSAAASPACNRGQLFYERTLGFHNGTKPVRGLYTAIDARAAYRKLARTMHPDHNPSPHAHDEWVLINEAYECFDQFGIWVPNTGTKPRHYRRQGHEFGQRTWNNPEFWADITVPGFHNMTYGHFFCAVLSPLVPFLILFLIIANTRQGLKRRVTTAKVLVGLLVIGLEYAAFIMVLNLIKAAQAYPEISDTIHESDPWFIYYTDLFFSYLCKTLVSFGFSYETYSLLTDLIAAAVIPYARAFIAVLGLLRLVHFVVWCCTVVLFFTVETYRAVLSMLGLTSNFRCKIRALVLRALTCRELTNIHRYANHPFPQQPAPAGGIPAPIVLTRTQIDTLDERGGLIYQNVPTFIESDFDARRGIVPPDPANDGGRIIPDTVATLYTTQVAVQFDALAADANDFLLGTLHQHLPNDPNQVNIGVVTSVLPNYSVEPHSGDNMVQLVDARDSGLPFFWRKMYRQLITSPIGQAWVRDPCPTNEAALARQFSSQLTRYAIRDAHKMIWVPRVLRLAGLQPDLDKPWWSATRREN